MIKWQNINAEKFVRGLRDRIEKGEKELEARIKKLESEMEVLQQRGLKYCGVFQKASLLDYGPGSAVTYQGSLWICTFPGPKGSPETDSDHWQLAVKAGRDAR